MYFINRIMRKTNSLSIVKNNNKKFQSKIRLIGSN